tara:strand:- start:419 stop:1840 length:1422 start_codon:yes stop_codon:yes gene_type:complete
MANFFNYPQVVMSLYDVPMEASGALSLGTSAGVGSGMAEIDLLDYTCQTGCNPHLYGIHRDAVANGGYVFYAAGYHGLQSYSSSSGGAAVDSICYIYQDGYSNWIYHCFRDITVGNNNMLFAHTSSSVGSSAGYRLMSFTHSSGVMTFKDDYKISTFQHTTRNLCADETLNLVYAIGNYGIGVYCYNSSTGVLGHTDYDYQYWQRDMTDVQVYTISSGCCVVVASTGYGLDLWCLNTSTCMLGLKCQVNWGGNSTDGCFNCQNDSPAGEMWGGCATGCHLSGGGYFILESCYQLNVICTYLANSTICFCLKSQYSNSALAVITSTRIQDLSGDDDYIYVTTGEGGASYAAIWQFSLNCSTGVLTAINCCNYQSNISPSVGRSRLFTCQGCCLYIQALGYNNSNGGDGCLSPGSWLYSKPAPHYSISGLYGGADNTNVALSHYYKGGSYVANNSSNTNVPTSGSIDFSDFYGQG